MKTVAIIGCGRIANSAHLPALSQIDEVRIKYACDLLIEKAEAAKEKFPKIENVVTDYQEVLKDPEVDAVYVLTPNYQHYTVTMAALKAGKHVFCEKPITVNYALSLQMAEEAKKQNKMLNIGVCNRYNAPVEMLRQYNLEGKFGNIYNVYCSFRNFRSIPGLGGAFTTKSQSGGGVLIDWGIHFLDLILYILDGANLRTVTCDAYSSIENPLTFAMTGLWKHFASFGSSSEMTFSTPGFCSPTALIMPAGHSAMRGVGLPNRGSRVVPLNEKEPKTLMSYSSANS